MTRRPLGSGGKAFEDIEALGPSVHDWDTGTSDDALAALRTELFRARKQLNLGTPAHAAAALTRLRARFSGEMEPSSDMEPEEILLRAAALTTLARLQERLGELDQGLFDQATAMFDATLRRPPHDAAPYAEECVVAFGHSGRFEDAKRLLNELPSGPERPDLLFELGQALRTHGRYEDACAALEQAAQLDPDDDLIAQALGELLAAAGERERAARSYYNAAASLFQEDRYEAAQRVIDRALELNPTYAEALGLKGELLRLAGQHVKALNSLDEALRLSPQSARLLIVRARIFLDLGRFDDALATLTRVREHGEESADLEINQAMVFRAMDRPEDFIAAAQAAIHLEPHNAVAHAVQAEAQSRLGRYEDALVSLDTAIRLQPAFWMALTLKARLLRRLGRQWEGIEAASRALELAPSNVPTLIELGWCLSQVGDQERAREILEQAMALDPDNAETLGAVGQVLRRVDPPMAVEVLQDALEKNAKLVWARDELVTALLLRNDREHALQVIEEGLRLEPDRPVETALLLADRGEVLRLLGQYEEAKQALEQALELDPDDAFALGTLGQVLIGLGQRADALRPLRRSFERLPGAEWVLETLVNALTTDSRYDEAMEVLWRAQGSGTDRDFVLALALLVGEQTLDPGEAAAAFDRALEAHPDWGVAQLGRANLYLVEGDHMKALKVVDLTLQVDPEWDAALFARSVVLEARGKFPEAEEIIDRLLEKRPVDEQFFRRKLDLVRLRNGQKEQQRVLRQFLKRHPELGWAYVLLGQSLRERGSDKDAVSPLRHAVKLGAGPPAVQELADVLLALDLPSEAADVVARELAENPTSPSLHTAQGNVLWALDRRDDALREFDQSLALDPRVPLVLASRSGVLFELRRYVEAIESCDAALEIEKDNVDALTVKGQALNELGEYEEAITLFARALTIIQPPLAWLQYLRGWALENLGDARQALADYTAVIRSDPKDLWAHQGVADCLLSLGEHRRARQKFRWIIRQSAERSDMERGDVLELGGWCHYQLDEYDQAIRILEDALAIDSLQPMSQFDLALAKLCGGDPKHAVVEYQRGLDIALLHEGLRAGSLLHVALADLRAASHTHGRVCEFDEYGDIQQALADARDAVREKVAEARAHAAVSSDGTSSTVA